MNSAGDMFGGFKLFPYNTPNM